jgi:hypothetical protein
MKRLAPASIDFVAEIMRLEERVSRELEFSFTVAADPSTLQDIFFALWPASALLGSESPQAWLFGMYLAKVFEREFGLKTDMNKAKSSNGKNRITNMPYIAFVQAVLADMKIADSGSPAPGTIYHHVKQVKPKKEK